MPATSGALKTYGRLNARRRHLARDFAACQEGTRPGDGNADLAARAVRAALNQAGLRASDLAYLIGHTTTPDEPLPSNVSRVASLLGYRGPVAEFRQACTGFVNATLFAAGLCATCCHIRRTAAWTGCSPPSCPHTSGSSFTPIA